jgi:hypothetical protein
MYTNPKPIYYPKTNINLTILHPTNINFDRIIITFPNRPQHLIYDSHLVFAMDHNCHIF